MSHLDLRIKMDTADIKVLKHLAEFTKKAKGTRLENLVFVWRPDDCLEVQTTNSFVLHRVVFGKIKKPYMTIDDGRVEDMQPLLNEKYLAVVNCDELLQVCRNILRHKKSTIDITCYLRYTTNSSNNSIVDGAVRQVNGIYMLDQFVGDYKLLNMMNFNFDFTEKENDYYNMYNVGIKTQARDLNYIDTLNNLWFKPKEFNNKDIELPNIFGMTAKNIADMSQVYDINKINNYDGKMLFKYMDNKFYVWSKYRSGAHEHILRKDNVKSIESILMGCRWTEDLDFELLDWLKQSSSKVGVV